MKKPMVRFFTVILMGLFCFSVAHASEDSLGIPLLPLNAEGRVEITGSGTSSLTRNEMVPLVIGWMYDTLDNGNIEEDGAAGIVTATGNFLIAEDEFYEGTRSIEFIEYTVTVKCSDNAYSYIITDADACVVTVLLNGAEGYMPSTSYDIIDITSVDFPGDYIALIESSSRERKELRERLEELLAEDMNSAKRGKMRRHERELQQTAEWFAAADGYYRTARENYGACCDFLLGLPLSLEGILVLGGEGIVELQ